MTRYAVPEFTVGAIAIDYSKIKLNELNGNDYDEVNGNDKFIELYNGGAERINLKGCAIYKDDGTDPVWVADAEVSIEAGGYLLLYSKKAHGATGYASNLIFDSGLSESKPVRIQLMSPANAKLDDFNLVTCVAPAQASYSRNADGGWYHAPATPGAANVDGTEAVQGLEGGAPIEPDYAKLILNELNGNDKFIEIYNANPVAISLEGVYIEKDNEQKWIGDNTLTMEPDSYVVLYSNKEEVVALHPDHPANLLFDGGLSEKKPVRVQLFDPSGNSLGDFNLVTCVIPAPASYSRNSDGNWYHAEATPGARNVDGTDPVEGLE
ncbi:MAG: lamin tail domain-containing protein [Bacteroidales bacterium]|nr:lamin tail domain-containing protein [Bacteroidales bacterium]